MRQRKLLEQQGLIITPTQRPDNMEFWTRFRKVELQLLQTSRTMSRLGGGNESHTSSFACENHTAGRLVLESLMMPCAHIQSSCASLYLLLSPNSSTSCHAFRSFDRLPSSSSRGCFRFSFDLHL